jgi:hypothetical protein
MVVPRQLAAMHATTAMQCGCKAAGSVQVMHWPAAVQITRWAAVKGDEIRHSQPPDLASWCESSPQRLQVRLIEDGSLQAASNMMSSAFESWRRLWEQWLMHWQSCRVQLHCTAVILVNWHHCKAAAAAAAAEKLCRCAAAATL